MRRTMRWTAAITVAVTALAAGSPAAAADLAAWRQKVDAKVLEAAALGQTDFLIYMARQADLSGAAALRGKAEKGTWVYARKAAAARESQAPVLAALDALGAWHRSFWIVNLVHARGGLAVVEAVAARDDVTHVYENAAGMLDPPIGAQSTGATAAETLAAAQWNLDITNADEVWAMGILGQGSVVAGADTGVEWQHPALFAHYRGWDGTTADHDYNWHDAIHTPNTECAGSSPEPCDDDALLGGGHGTHTVGTMVGDDGAANRTGMAPAAQWMACRNMHYGVGVVTTYLECMEWFLAPTDGAGENPDPAKSPHVINNSWACVEVCPPTVLKEGTEAIRAAGIVYVASAGNDGSACSTIAFAPAIYQASLTVGATNNVDNVASFSSRGPVLTLDPLNPHRKPDVSAPGVGVRSALKGGAYGNLSGTSMAGPHVAGLVALLISANPDLAGDVDAIEDIVERTAFARTTTQGCGGDTATQVPNNVYGYGRIDALAAVQEAIRLRRVCAEVDDADGAVEYRGGWHRVEDADASAGGYHRRMGSKNGGARPSAKLVFDGDEVTYRFATSTAGGTADLYLDGVLRQTLSYAGSAPHDNPAFDGVVTFSGLAAGAHELRIEHRGGAATVDGFTVCGPGAAADASAAAYRSETQVSQGSSPLGLVERTLQVGAADEEVSVVVEGAAAAPTVHLLGPAGNLLASGGALLQGLTAAGLDAAPAGAGTYTVQVLTAPGGTVTISTARTVRE
ncbi:MAG TPA: S8 family serine peptidase [Thermoanaerobaculia bacterium]|nr:S8 family serine peptidase [Thermoanaerobaculia bacterium]